MKNIRILESIFDKKIINILKLLLADKEKQFYLREISNLTKVPVATTYRILQKLVDSDVIRQIKIKKFKFYQAMDNETVAFLDSIIKEEKKVLQEFINKIKDIRGLQAIILHGKETENKANLLLIGKDINPDKIKAVVTDIKEKYKFTISSLALTREQYQQMSDMGLYSGTKKILFEKAPVV